MKTITKIVDHQNGRSSIYFEGGNEIEFLHSACITGSLSPDGSKTTFDPPVKVEKGDIVVLFGNTVQVIPSSLL